MADYFGRFDIQSQVVSMSRFKAAPTKGHLERFKRIHAYVVRAKDYAIRLRVHHPDYSYLPEQNFNWTHTIHGDVKEIIPEDIAEALGKTLTTTPTTTVDANLNHCLDTGRSLTGCLHFVNQTPIDSYSKRQATVEKATYGSVFVVSKAATKQILDLRHTL